MKASIQILEGNGYVWDADVARWLRQECGIVGSMVGGVSAFKQQNAVHGLPLELSPEEVTLTLERGWGALQAPLHTGALAAALGGGGGGDGGRKRGRGEPSGYQYYAEEEEDAYMDDQAAEQQPAVEPTWRAALAGSAAFTVPTTPAEAAAANAGQPWPPADAEAATADGTAAASGAGAAAQPAAEGSGAAAQPAPAPVSAPAAAACAVEQQPAVAVDGGGGAAPVAGEGGGAAEQQPVEWSWPGTEAERHRYWVFRDLHAKGYRLTGGSKFGADYLVYPGDPTLYHAQFCVRLVGHADPLLPVMLASATRGSHQARKHLLLASVSVGADGSGQQGQLGGGEASGGDAQQQQGQQGQQQGQQDEEQGWRSEAGWRTDATAAAATAGGGEAQPGRRAGGVGAGGERYRIHYMTIGPVEGFGG